MKILTLSGNITPKERRDEEEPGCISKPCKVLKKRVCCPNLMDKTSDLKNTRLVGNTDCTFNEEK